MSRLIVKNLPNNVTEKTLREHFSQKGVVTDVQLKYTRDGKFRHFAFVGFQEDQSAQLAKDYFHKSYFHSSRITVETCAELADDNKPRAWSKYNSDTTAFKKLHGNSENTEKIKNEVVKSKVKTKIKDPSIIELIEKHKDDPSFKEYLSVHGHSKNIWENDDSLSLTASKLHLHDESIQDNSGFLEEDDVDTEDKNNIADDSNVSDLDYFKLKAKQISEEKIQKCIKKSPYITIKMCGIPYNTKKKDIKDFFHPLKLDSIRIPTKIKGFAYVAFKTEMKAQKAFDKDKSFIRGKQIRLHRSESKIESESKEDEDTCNKKWKTQELSLQMEETIAESGRIFARNLSYSVTEDELQKLFAKYGPVTEALVPIDKNTRLSKGFALITFLMPEHAVKAYTELDGTIFHGRMLHLLPGKAKELQEFDMKEGSSYKTKKMGKLKKESGSSHNWNSLFLGQNAIAEVIADSYDISKEQVLSGNNAAVRLALGETQLVNETKEFLEESGVKLDAFNQIVQSRSKTVILVKNLPAKTEASEIRELFSKFGLLGRVLLPPNGITGIVEFLEPSEARSAFHSLAYSKFKNLPLYLEWAPDDTFTTSFNDQDIQTNKQVLRSTSNDRSVDDKCLKTKEMFDTEGLEPEADTTLFIKNLNFDTTEESIRKHFVNCGNIANVIIAKKKDPSKPGVILSMGYGFIQFYTQSSLNTALKTLQQSSLDGHTIELKRSNRTVRTESSANRKKNNVEEQTGSKILVRNIPFQAKESEILELFKTFGEIKSLRIPKKMVGTGPHRGFGFVDYFSKFDAKRAMEALCQSTHLYGRRLVLEWAQTDDNDVEYLRKRTAKHFHSDTTKRSKKSTADMEVNNQDSDN